MNLLAPSWLFLGLLAIPILLMYMLKLRRREVTVSSTLLWQTALRDRQANTPWQRIRRNLLLFLQLLILAGLALALSRPAIWVKRVTSGSVVLLLDASASMSATDVTPSRFEAARGTTRRLINAMNDQAHMTLILVSFHPAVLASAENDKSRLLSALDAAVPGNGAADWRSAFALAAGAASQEPGKEPPAIVIISDGGLPAEGLPPLPGEISYIPIGTSGENLGVSALALRATNGRNELFASVSNHGSQDHQAVLSLYRNGELFNAQQLSVPAKGNVSASIKDLPQAEAIYQARLSPVESTVKNLDALPLDDSAFAISHPSTKGRALIISRGNFFLEQVLAAMPSISAFRALPTKDSQDVSSIQLPVEPFDLYIIDGLLPTNPKTGLPVMPEGNLLMINPPPTVLFNVTGTFTDTANQKVADQSLMQYVDWSGVHIAKASHVKLPAWAEVLVSADGGPLVFAGDTGGRRVAVLTFDLHDSDLPLQVAFPVLFSNLVNYLVPPQSVQATEGILPGETLSILPEPGVEQIAIASPSGKIYSLPPQENGVQFDETGELGVYAVNLLKDKSQNAEYFAVNLFDEQETDIAPASAIHVGQQVLSASQEQKLSQLELWRWMAALALLILLIEWWVYHRRQTTTGILAVFRNVLRTRI